MQRRIASALVLAGVALATAGVAGPFGVKPFGAALFAAIWGAAATALVLEWQRLVAPDGWRPPAIASALGVAGAAVAVLARAPFVLGVIAALAAVAAAALALPGRRLASGMGALAGVALLVAVVALRASDRMGLLALLWLFAVVWGADTAAYFAGRAIGGPLLAPLVSPRKTWSGFLVGSLVGAGAGWGVLWLAGTGPGWSLAALGLGAALASALGDLAESWFKRRCGAKDSGALIPGHGGALDRLDGFATAAVLAAALGLARGGFDGAAAGLLTW